MACGGGRLSPFQRSSGQDWQPCSGVIRKEAWREGWSLGRPLKRTPCPQTNRRKPRWPRETETGPGVSTRPNSVPAWQTPVPGRHGVWENSVGILNCHSRVGPRQVHSPFGSTKPHFPELNNRICIKGQIFKRGEGNTVLGLSEPAEAERQMKVVQVKPKRTSITQNLPRFQNLGCKFQKERIACPVTPQSPLPTVFSR